VVAEQLSSCILKRSVDVYAAVAVTLVVCSDTCVCSHVCLYVLQQHTTTHNRNGEAVSMTLKHKPDREDEVLRIAAANGWVTTVST
jgi:Protein phosphatase 2C